MASNAGERRTFFKSWWNLTMLQTQSGDLFANWAKFGVVRWRNAMALVDSNWWQTLYNHGCDIGSDFSQLCLALICWSDTSPEHSTALSPFTHDLPKRCCDEDLWNWNLWEHHTHVTGDMFSSVLGMLQILGEACAIWPRNRHIHTSIHPHIHTLQSWSMNFHKAKKIAFQWDDAVQGTITYSTFGKGKSFKIAFKRGYVGSEEGISKKNKGIFTKHRNFRILVSHGGVAA